MFELKLSRLRHAIAGGSMAMEVLFDEILDQDVEFKIDQAYVWGTPERYKDWLLQRGAKSVTIRI